MEIILLQDVKELGKENDVLTVRDGYGRNFLIPKGLAAVASIGAMKDLAEKHKQDARREEKLLKDINSVVDVLKQTTFKVAVKAGTTGRIFGRVTPLQVSEAIKKQKSISIDRRKVAMPEEEIASVGTYTVTVNLHKEVSVPITIEVFAE